ncbi:MAG: glycosyltransferase family 2 protein [Clostridia bacterium]|jgi:glycosyltransferase involved in cell wall biosynthesis|nr:glycosyltransferase family 2 protein [Clostridia bacterium]
MSVTAIIPAYNEEKYINNVLKALKEVEEITQIIVVSDGSTDNTVQKALSWDVQVIALTKNIGKGGALTVGLKYALEENILFLDADLIGLTKQHIEVLIRPVLEGQVEMTVGIFEHGRLATDMAQFISPYLSGQRCLKKKWLEQIDNLAISGFGVEIVLNHFAEQNKLPIKIVHLPNMSHVMKEEKLGLVRGFAYRMKMYWEIAKSVRMGG